MSDSIVKNVVKNLGQIAAETVEKTAEETIKIASGVITGQELVGDAKALNSEEESKVRVQEAKKQEEMDHLRQEATAGQGRNVEKEIKEVRDEKAQKEEEEQRQFLENIKRQREAEEREREQMVAQNEISTNPAKQKKSRGSAFATGKKKSQPQMDQMSQTSEFKGKID